MNNEFVLQLKNISFTYSNGTSPILNNINLSVRQGEVVAIYGNNGSGKSTLLKVIANKLSSSYQGDVFLNGKKIEPGDESILYKQISFPDKNVANGFRVKDELSNFGEVSKENISLIAEYFKCESLLKKRMSSLSMGQKQLVYVMKTFLKQESNLLLFDEPISNLDRTRAIMFSNYIKDFIKKNPHKAVIIVTHCRMFPKVTAYNLQKGDLKILDEKSSCNTCFGVPDEEGYYEIDNYIEEKNEEKRGFFKIIKELFS